jgi:hypothetical protein
MSIVQILNLRALNGARCIQDLVNITLIAVLRYANTDINHVFRDGVLGCNSYQGLALN